MPSDWLEDFEVRLEALAQCARRPGSVLPDVLHACHQAFAVLAEGTAVDICLQHADTLEITGTTQPQRPSYSDELLRRIAAAGQDPATTDFRDDSPWLGTCLLGGHRTLICVFHFESLVVPASSCHEAIGALTDSVGQFASRMLLDRADAAAQTQQRLATLAASMAGCSRMERAAVIAVTDGANIVTDCRISLLRSHSERPELLAITGASQAPPRSATTAALQAAALNPLAVDDADWLDPAQDLPAGMSALTQGGVRRLMVLSAEGPLIMIVESFDDQRLPGVAEVRQLARTVLMGMSRFPHGLSRWTRRGRWLRYIAVTAAAAVALLLIPTDFEIEVQGRVQPTRWQRVFAPDDGTIDAVMFDNESDVENEQPLFEMSNPDYRQELGKTLGDIETTLTELAAAKTRRLSGTDPTASADEQMLTARLSSLEGTRDLLQEQIDQLQVSAPFDGTVFLHNAREDLTTRPVRRGQMLLRVVAKDTSWQLELDVPEDVRGYVCASRKDSDDRVKIDYLVRAASDSSHETTLQSIDGSIRLVDSQLICRAVAPADGLPPEHRRPGTSVVARISCGQRSLGFVWFRELVETWRYIRFAWL
ncbi:MAG: hypothetical protein NXI04_29415 [Planctomycetaceae bacterium]|nr:hypothetical protein [Planctomycetaceae bacterium]